MSSLYTDSEQALARIAIEMHSGDNLKVLIGGLGLGFTAREALESDRVERVQVVEVLPQVIEWLHNGLLPFSDQLQREMQNDESGSALQTEPRLVITCDDVYRRLARKPEEFLDIILIDVDHSPDDRLDDNSVSFYTVDGLQSARQHLAPNGVLAVWSYAESSSFADGLHEVFDHIRVVPITHDNQLIDERQTDWLFFVRN